MSREAIPRIPFKRKSFSNASWGTTICKVVFAASPIATVLQVIVDQ